MQHDAIQWPDMARCFVCSMCEHLSNLHVFATICPFLLVCIFLAVWSWDIYGGGKRPPQSPSQEQPLKSAMTNLVDFVTHEPFAETWKGN